MENSISNVNIFCRVCFSENNTLNDMTKPTENNSKTLLQMFIEVTHIEVNSEFTPLLLCETCTKNLDTSYSFLKQCEKSNVILYSNISATPFLGEQQEEVSISEDLLEAHRNTSKNQCVKQTLRLAQVSYNKVSQAIKESEGLFKQNVECIKCGFICSNSRALSIHISYCHRELKGHWCSHCNGEFDNLLGHVETHHVNSYLKCQFCTKSFRQKGHLIEHLLGHSGHRPHKCEVCQKTFLTVRHLRLHTKTHSSKKLYICHTCKKSFNQKVSLKLHLRKHSDKDVPKQDVDVLRLNFCTICNKNVRSLMSHMEEIHSGKLESGVDYKLCTECGKQFKTIGKLQLHMRVHTGEAPYECGTCSKRFSTRHHLIVHGRTHTGDKPHVCHVCGKCFSQSSVLNTHLKIHTGRPEICKICDQKFCRPAQLRLHMRKHTGEKPYVCKVCGHAFIQCSHLTQHEKTHSGERPYACKYCDKSFIQSSSLKSHVDIHFGNKPYKCTVCSYACRQSYSLRIHMKKHSVSDSARKIHEN